MVYFQIQCILFHCQRKPSLFTFYLFGMFSNSLDYGFVILHILMADAMNICYSPLDSSFYQRHILVLVDRYSITIQCNEVDIFYDVGLKIWLIYIILLDNKYKYL